MSDGVFLISAPKVSQVECTREIKLKISEICSLLDVDGIRGDMVINRAARALVALEGRGEVGLDDVAKVIGLCLNHRRGTSCTVKQVYCTGACWVSFSYGCGVISGTCKPASH